MPIEAMNGRLEAFEGDLRGGEKILFESRVTR